MSSPLSPILVKVEVASPNAIPKLRVNKYRCFLEVMAAWYRDLSRKERKHLTTKRFKRRALLELERLQYEYNSLPHDWVSVLLDKYGVKLNEKRKKIKPPVPALLPASMMNGADSPKAGRAKDVLNQMQQNVAPINAGEGVTQTFPGYTHKLMQRGGLERIRPLPTPPSHDHITLSWLLDRPGSYKPVKVYNKLMAQSQRSQRPQIRPFSGGSFDSDRFNLDEGPTQADPEIN